MKASGMLVSSVRRDWAKYPQHFTLVTSRLDEVWITGIKLRFITLSLSNQFICLSHPVSWSEKENINQDSLIMSQM